MRNSDTQIRVLVDTKNLALYSGGIAGFFTPLLRSWISRRPAIQFTLVSPKFDLGPLKTLANCTFYELKWPNALPRSLRHAYYDNILFPLAHQKIRPDFIFSPYYDIRLPRKTPSAMMIHDACFAELPDLYPLKIRTYYQHMLRLNLKRAAHIFTVSEASKQSIIKYYTVPEAQIDVIPNAVSPLTIEVNEDLKFRINRLKLLDPGALKVFYCGGSDHRKNTRRLVQAISLLKKQGKNPKLWVAGSSDRGWERELASFPKNMLEGIEFRGHLDPIDLVAHYQAADVIVYPSLCEGFGRVCLESMELGAPLACSDLPVLREVVGDYAMYFNPYEVEDIATGIWKAATKGRSDPKRDIRFELERVEELFISSMDKILERLTDREKR